MPRYSSYESLYKHIKRLIRHSHKPLFFILVGGSSRTGKSTLTSMLSSKFKADGIETNIINLDPWLISMEKRRSSSTVMERYDCDGIQKSIKAILKGKRVFPPVYDVVSRKRIAEKSDKFLMAKSGIVFIEGVIALALKRLLELAELKIFTNIPDKIRLKRLTDFYVNTKELTYDEAERIIQSREKEEVAFIKKTAEQADIIFSPKTHLV